MKLPKYTRQVTTSGEAGGVRGDVASAGNEWKAVGKIASQVTGIATDVFTKINDEKTKSQSAEYSANFDRDWAVAQGEMVKLPPDQQDAFYQNWRKQKEDELANSGYTKDATSILSNNLKGRFAQTDIKAMGIAHKAEIGAIDNSLIRVQQSALDGQPWTDPETGEVHSPEDAFKIATDARIRIDSSYTEQGLKSIRSFGQVTEYRNISKTASQNPQEAEKQLSESNQSPENTALLGKVIQDAKDRQSKQSQAYQTKEDTSLNKLLNDRELSRTELESKREETQNIMGNEVPAITNDQYKAYTAWLDIQVGKDQDGAKGLFGDITKSLKNIAKSAGKGKFNEKELKEVYGIIAYKEKGKSKFAVSKASMEMLLNDTSETLLLVAEGKNWNETTTRGMMEVADLYQTMFEEMPSRSKAVMQALPTKISSYMQFVKEHDGKVNDAQLDEWRKENLTTELRGSAMIRARNTYRVGEPVIAPDAPDRDTALLDFSSQWSEGKYRYVGGGNFERID